MENNFCELKLLLPSIMVRLLLRALISFCWCWSCSDTEQMPQPALPCVSCAPLGLGAAGKAGWLRDGTGIPVGTLQSKAREATL